MATVVAANGFATQPLPTGSDITRPAGRRKFYMAAHHPLPPGPWLRFVIYWKNADTQWQNDIWYNVTAVGSTVAIDTILLDFVSVISDAWLEYESESNYLVAVKVYANNGTFTVSQVAYPNAQGSVVLAADIPVQVTLIAALDSEIATRRANGRIKIGGINTQDVTGDYPSTGAATWVQDLVTALRGFIEASGWAFALAVWERVNATLHDVINGQISPKLGNVRRRRPRI